MSSIEPSGSGTHGLRRHPHTPTHPTQPSKPSPAFHNTSPYQLQYQPHGSYGSQVFPQVNGNVPNGSLRGPGAQAHNALGQRHPGRHQQMPQPQQPNPSSMMFGPVSQSVPHDSSMAHQHQRQQHPGHSSHQGHPGRQHHGPQHQSSYPQQQQPQPSQHQQSHLQRQQQQQQYQLTLQHMVHQPPPHQQPHHDQQQPSTQHQHRRQSQPQMPHQQPKKTLQQPPQPLQQQPRQPQPQFPQAQPQTQMPHQIQLQPQAPQPETGRNHTPLQKAPQPPTRTVQPQSAPPVQKDVDVMDMDGSREGGLEMSGLNSQILQDPSFQPLHPMGEMMSPPPEGGNYPTLEAVQKAVLRYCTSVGYAIVIGRSKKTGRGLKKVLFVCDRAGKPPSRVSPEHRKRKTSRKCDCPFSFFAIEQGTQWTIRRRPDKQHLQHNHGPSESPLHHRAARKLDSKMVAAVKQLKENGVGVSETLQILQNENPDCHLLPKDIYNARAAINRNPPKLQTTRGVLEEAPTISTKQPHRIRSELRSQLWKARGDLKKVEEEKNKEIDSLKDTIKEKDKMIAKFEMFIDICNQRERVSGPGEDWIASTAARNQS